MGSGLGLLNDKSTYEDNFITNIDPRIKLISSFVFLAVIISTENIYIPVTIMLFMVAGILCLKINKKVFLFRGLPAVLIAFTILITQVFLYGNTPWFTLHIFGFEIYGYIEGFNRGLLLMCRVLAGISTMLFLTLSTPINKLIFAMAWLRFPKAFIEVLTITYRYIFVLFEEMSTVKNAQKIRLGYSSFDKSIKSFGTYSGIIILRTIDKSEKLYKAMKSRGYNGQQIIVHYNAIFTKSDCFITVFLFLIVGITLMFFY